MSKTKSLVAADPAVFVDPFRVDGAKPFHLTSYPTAERGGIDKDKGQEIIKANRDRLSDLQEKLYAHDRWSLLLIFQSMDASGKDSAIESVFDGVNPQGCDVHSFKQPSVDRFRSASCLAFAKRRRCASTHGLSALRATSVRRRARSR